MRILAPLRSVEEAAPLADAGADELYFGYVDEGWEQRGIFTDKSSRRHSKRENLSTPDELARVIRTSHDCGVETCLAVNNQFTEFDYDLALGQIRLGIELGVDRLIVCDIGLLCELRRMPGRVPAICLSTTAGAGNCRALDFYRKLGVSRVVLPRHLSLDEIGALTAPFPDLEFEALVLNDGCNFDDGVCGFFHKSITQKRPVHHMRVMTRVDELIPARLLPALVKRRATLQCCIGDAEFSVRAGDDSPNAARIEAYYRRWFRHTRLIFRCGLCAVQALQACGVSHFKIAGRGYSLRKKVRDIRMLRETIDTATKASPSELADHCRRLFRRHNGFSCNDYFCYFSEYPPCPRPER